MSTCRANWSSNRPTLVVGNYYSQQRPPISRLLHKLYEGPCRFVLRHPKATITFAVLLVASTVPIYLRLGSEFMPPLKEGTILYRGGGQVAQGGLGKER